jgi:hypothetical protein
MYAHELLHHVVSLNYVIEILYLLRKTARNMHVRFHVGIGCETKEYTLSTFHNLMYPPNQA